MPELLVALDACELLVFEAAVEAMALEVPVGAGVVDENGLVGESGEGEGFVLNPPVPRMEGGGIGVQQKENGGMADSVLDEVLVDELVPVVRLGELAGAEADDPGFGFPGGGVAMFEAAFDGAIIIQREGVVLFFEDRVGLEDRGVGMQL